MDTGEQEKQYQLPPFYMDSKEQLALHLQTMKLHDLKILIREVGVDEITWEAINKDAKEFYSG